MSFQFNHRRQRPKSTVTLPTLSLPIPTLSDGTRTTARGPSFSKSSSTSVSSTYPFNKLTLTSVQASTHVVTPTFVPSTSSAQPSNTSSPSNVGAATRAAVGGAFAAIIGIAVLACAFIFLTRRHRRRRDQDAFDAASFRRSAVILPEHTTQERGHSPRPPTVIERKLANTPPASPSPWAQQFNVAHQYGQALETVQLQQYGPEHGYGNVNVQSYPFHDPGQVLANAAPATPISAAPLLPPATQEPSLLSPIASPVVAPNFLPDQSIRQSSDGNILQKQSSGAELRRHPSDPHYIDLSRSSISPFQATQYAEISRTLNADVPIPLPEPSKTDKKASDQFNTLVEEIPDPAPPYKERQSASIEDKANKASPFADPVVPQVSEEHDVVSASDHGNSDTSHPRVTSIAPVLPEIGLSQRMFSPTPFSSAFNSVVSPTQPLPVGKNDRLATTSNNQLGRPDSAYVTDDPDDAYGGI